MSNPNNDPNNLHPSPEDPFLAYDEALKGFTKDLQKTDIEDLVQILALIEQKLLAANA